MQDAKPPEAQGGVVAVINSIGRLIKGIRPLAVARIEDLPYWTSPPIQFVYRSTATLNLGSYTWADAPPQPLASVRPLLSNTLYYFRHVSLSADISELDYTSNLVTTPDFRMYLKSGGDSLLFREPIAMTNFLENWDFRQVWETHQDFSEGQGDALLAAFTGSLLQGAGLIGKADVTLTAVISAQEIVDDEYIKAFKDAYPQIVKSRN